MFCLVTCLRPPPPEYAYRHIRRSDPVFHVRRVELAPEGWRTIVEAMATGYGEVIGEHAYCQNCGAVIRGAEGHLATCLTMVARRMLFTEKMLLASHFALQAQGPMLGVDIDKVHHNGPAVADSGQEQSCIEAKQAVDAVLTEMRNEARTETLSELRQAIRAIKSVGDVAGARMIRRESVIDLIDQSIYP